MIIYKRPGLSQARAFAFLSIFLLVGNKGITLKVVISGK
jgi:hypothetical protein